jgi:hypothetical protein
MATSSARLFWWDGDPTERFWYEISARPDTGADLKCPQRDDSNKVQWSYDLIRHTWPGDIVFHYSTTRQAFIGVSVAGGPLEERDISWGAGHSASRRDAESPARPGWRLPVYGYRRIAAASAEKQ